MRELISYSFVMPPTIFIVICLAGACISLRFPRIGTKITLVSSMVLYVLATPATSKFLLHWLVSPILTDVDLTSARAIVVFSADIRLGDHLGASETVGLLTLDRLAGAAQLYRRLHLPIIVSGGKMPHARVSSATLMRDELEHNFLVPVMFSEEASGTTYENAKNTSRILATYGYDSVIIVLQQRDIPRALWSFSQFGIQALPYPTDHLTVDLEFSDFFPSAGAFKDSYYIFHEIIGVIYYKIIY
jgi:uncharacterized SAM-binding protein YcdF (DUF218 family)